MPRLQVLHLPSSLDCEPRYAFVVDQAADLPEPDREALSAFAATAGGQGCVVLSGTVDLAQGEDDDEETTEALGELLRDALTAPAVPAGSPPAAQRPKLPPANTTEGKLARVWRGKPPTEGEDPR